MRCTHNWTHIPMDPLIERFFADWFARTRISDMFLFDSQRLSVKSGKTALFASILLTCLTAGLAAPTLPVTRSNTILWAWDRNEDLRFLPPHTEVAFLAATVTINPAGVSHRFREHPLLLSPSQPRIAVVRIEARNGPIGPHAHAPVLGTVLHAASLPGVRGIQIDFDARHSQQSWYRDLLIDTRRQLRGEESLSITALASWCEGDDWIAGLPLDEAVPMVFRLGPEREGFRRMVMEGRRFREPLCNSSVGLSTDEWIALPDGWRSYWFSPSAWTPARYTAVAAR